MWEVVHCVCVHTDFVLSFQGFSYLNQGVWLHGRSFSSRTLAVGITSVYGWGSLTCTNHSSWLVQCCSGGFREHVVFNRKRHLRILCHTRESVREVLTKYMICRFTVSLIHSVVELSSVYIFPSLIQKLMMFITASGQ